MCVCDAGKRSFLSQLLSSCTAVCKHAWLCTRPEDLLPATGHVDPVCRRLLACQQSRQDAGRSRPSVSTVMACQTSRAPSTHSPPSSHPQINGKNMERPRETSVSGPDLAVRLSLPVIALLLLPDVSTGLVAISEQNVKKSVGAHACATFMAQLIATNSVTLRSPVGWTLGVPMSTWEDC